MVADPIERRATIGVQRLGGVRRSVAAGIRIDGLVLVGGRARSTGPGVDLAAAALLQLARLCGRRTAVVGFEPGTADGRRARRRIRALVRNTDLLVVRTSDDADLLVAAGARPPFRVGTDEEGLRLARLLIDGGSRAGLAAVDGLRLHPPVRAA